MLVKIQSRSYADDYGVLVDGPSPYIHMFENGIVPLSARVKVEPVIQVRALWMEREARVTCDVADTDTKKRIGLQSYNSLKENHGMYFPYPGSSDVIFHQGSVPFSLDLIFLRDGRVIALKQDTEIGGTEQWSCPDCDGVIEVSSGYCKTNSVDVGDALVIWAYSQQDIDSYKKDRKAIQAELASQLKNLEYRVKANSLMHEIIGEDYYG